MTNSSDRIRKVASYTELVKTPLTRKELDDAKERVVEYLDHVEAIEAELAEVKATFKARLEKARSEQEKWRSLYKGKHRQSTDLIEEWLKGNNEIERVNTRTGEILGTRNAKPEELQETLPFVPAEPGQDDPPDLDADANAEGDDDEDEEEHSRGGS